MLAPQHFKSDEYIKNKNKKDHIEKASKEDLLF